MGIGYFQALSMIELGLLVKSLKNPSKEEIEKFDLMKLRIRKIVCALLGFSVLVFISFVIASEIAFGKFGSIDDVNVIATPKPKQNKTITAFGIIT